MAKKKSSGVTTPTKDDAGDTVNREVLAIQSILPEARDHPEVYNSAIERLKKSNLRVAPKWADCSLWKSWRGWFDVEGMQKRPSLEFFMACLAAHAAYNLAAKSKFMQEVEKLELMDWAMGKLQPETSAKEPAKKPAAKPQPLVKIEKEGAPELPKDTAAASRTLENVNDVLPSIEGSIQPVHQRMSSSRHSNGEISPFQSTRFLKRKLSTASEAQDSKRVSTFPNSSSECHRRVVATSSAATQTDSEMVDAWALDHARKLIERGKGFFADEMAQQNKVLTEFLPGTIREVIQQTLSDEVVCQQFARSIQSQVVQPGITGMQHARPSYQSYAELMSPRSYIPNAADYQYEDIRTVDGRAGSRGLATIVPAGLDRPLDLSGYRLIRAPEHRRF